MVSFSIVTGGRATMVGKLYFASQITNNENNFDP
jgi:hypothetical protein